MHVKTCKHLVTRLGAQKLLHVQHHLLGLEDLRTKIYVHFFASSLPNFLKNDSLSTNSYFFLNSSHPYIGHLDAHLAKNQTLSRRNQQSFYSWSYWYMIINTQCFWSVIIKHYHWFSISIEQEIYFNCSITPPFPSVWLKWTIFSQRNK